MIRTGWYGIPGGSEHSSTRVHVVVDGKPACGVVLADAQEFQWCARGISLEYVECDRCRKWAAKHGRNRV